ncbi:M24 family metallopeptidase [Candidatus Zixiibacteriota bacterium]
MRFTISGVRGRGILTAFAFLLLFSTGPLSAQVLPAEYAARQTALTMTMGDGLYYFQADVASNGRQNPDFHYLTGVVTSPARLLMVRTGEQTDAVIFLPEGSDTRPGIRPLAEFDQAVREALATRATRLITSLSPTQNEVVAGLVEQMIRPSRLTAEGFGPQGFQLLNPSGTLRNMRGTKSPAEIELLQIASDITRNAHIAAMRTSDIGLNEFELQAVIEYTFMRNGAARPGFDSIIGSGPNSLVLHWSDNNRFMEDGDVIVMDIGAEYFGYTSDVTRTIPVSGTFTREQRDIYEVVLAAHLAAAELAEVEGTPYSDLSAVANEVLSEGLARLGLIESPGATAPGSSRGRARSQLGLFYYHGLGHGIGLVVHDSMPEGNVIVEGACFTIEPGIYVRPDVLDMLGTGDEAEALRQKLAPVVARYANIGIRIEDSYAFTDRGLVCLSRGTPRTADEVEAMMALPNLFNELREGEIVEKFRNFIPPGNFQ